MENYIVRIYSRDQNDPNKVQGMLEAVEQETRQPFKTISALQTLLTSAVTTALPEPDKPDTKTKHGAVQLSLAKSTHAT